jgi:hypothetical protein
MILKYFWPFHIKVFLVILVFFFFKLFYLRLFLAILSYFTLN